MQYYVFEKIFYIINVYYIFTIYENMYWGFRIRDMMYYMILFKVTIDKNPLITCHTLYATKFDGRTT